MTTTPTLRTINDQNASNVERIKSTRVLLERMLWTLAAAESLGHSILSQTRARYETEPSHAELAAYHEATSETAVALVHLFDQVDRLRQSAEQIRIAFAESNAALADLPSPKSP